jgi:outer membrane lipoprotein SlyB
MQGTNDMTMAGPASALRSPAALVGGAALVAALGLGGGWMLRGTSSPAPAAATPVATVPAPGQEPSNGAPVYTPEGPPAGAARLAPPETPADEVQRPAAAAPAPVQHAPQPAPQPAHRSVARAPAHAAPAVQPQPPVSVAPPAQPVAQAPVCRSCGVVESVQTVRQEGPAQGIGAVAGGVLGGVLGNQVGGGTGRKVATVLGAVGGGFAGHEIEKRVRSETVYEVRVRMEDGSVRRFSQAQPIATGTRVVDEGGRLRVQ